MNCTGIVLKKLSQHKVAFLDEHLGRIDGVTKKELHVGAFMHYTVQEKKGTLSFLDQNSIIDLPFFWGRSDILFWHHVLELCYFFMPVGTYAPQLFELLSFLYTVEKNDSWGPHAKKIYLFKLLSTIGIQVEMPHISELQLHWFLAVPLAQINQEVLNEESEKIMNEWLRICVSEHPAIEQFKTIRFLVDE